MNRFFNRATTARIVISGCVLTLLFALFSLGVYQYDEHFQILEYANMKLFGNPAPENLAWEYPEMMRPGLMPMIAYVFGKALVGLGIYNPFTLVRMLQLFSGVVSVSVMLFFLNSAQNEIGSLKWRKWYLLIGFFAWFLAYLHVHFNAEMLAGNMLLLLTATCLRWRRADDKNQFLWGLSMGLAVGLAFLAKYQTGFALAGFGLWLIVHHRRWRLYAGIAAGVLFMLAVGTLIDRWLYGTWSFTPYNYLRENILESRMRYFGSEPWYFYLTQPILEGGIIFGAAVMAATGYYFYRHPRSLVTWMLVPFIAVHFFLAHKEIRFLFPVLFFAPYFIVMGLRRIPWRILRSRAWRIIVLVVGAVNCVILLMMLVQPSVEIDFFRTMRRITADDEKNTFLTTGGSYYAMQQTATRPRVMTTEFYLPKRTELKAFVTVAELDSAIRLPAAPGEVRYLFSSDGTLEEQFPAVFRKIDWRPYPRWVVRYFNFNDWTRFAVRSKNAYRIVPDAIPDHQPLFSPGVPQSPLENTQN